MYTTGQGYEMQAPGQGMAGQWPPQMSQPPPVAMDADDDGDNAHRPPNAFILYSQAMRSAVRQENPSLSNTECSRLLGKMWKEVPSDVKMQYKQRAAAAQEEFKKNHPNYTYRKARRKRALNELLTKSSQGMPFADQIGTMGMMGGQYPMMQMYAPMGMGTQPGQNPALGTAAMGMTGMPAQMGMPQQGQMGMPMAMGYPGLDPNSMYPIPNQPR